MSKCYFHQPCCCWASKWTCEICLLHQTLTINVTCAMINLTNQRKSTNLLSAKFTTAFFFFSRGTWSHQTTFTHQEFLIRRFKMLISAHYGNSPPPCLMSPLETCTPTCWDSALNKWMCPDGRRGEERENEEGGIR